MVGTARTGGRQPPAPAPPTPTPPVALPAVVVKPDPGRAASAPIGPEGGTLSATAADGARIELVVPADALDFTEVITLTPASAVEALPLSGGLATAASLEPAGLALYRPATLRITPAAAPTGPHTVGFAFDGNGSEFHLRPTTAVAPGSRPDGVQAAANPIVQPVPILRGYGAGGASDDDIARRKAAPRPSDPIDDLEELFVPIPIPGARDQLHISFMTHILPLLKRAAADAALADQALVAVDRWFQLARDNGVEDQLIEQMVLAKEQIISILERAANAASERCVSQKRPEEGFALLRWARYAREFLPGRTDAMRIEAMMRRLRRFLL